MLLMLIMPVLAATIYGTIYDYSLNKAKDARVEINTEPKQFYISKNGSYAFNANNGKYSIEAKQYAGTLLKASATENVTIKDEGAYVLDLVLFPSLGEGEFEEDILVRDPFDDGKIDTIWILAAIAIIATLFLAFISEKAEYPQKAIRKTQAMNI